MYLLPEFLYVWDLLGRYLKLIIEIDCLCMLLTWRIKKRKNGSNAVFQVIGSSLKVEARKGFISCGCGAQKWWHYMVGCASTIIIWWHFVSFIPLWPIYKPIMTLTFNNFAYVMQTSYKIHVLHIIDIP